MLIGKHEGKTFMKRLSKRWRVLLGKQVLPTLIGATLLGSVPHDLIAATLTTDEMASMRLSGVLLDRTVSDCIFMMPAVSGFLDGVTVTWSGACIEGHVSGPGELRGMRDEKEVFTFEGNMQNGLPDGEGIYHLAGVMTLAGRFRGTTLDDEHAVITTEKGFRYEGAVKENRPEGVGMASFPDGTRYEGQWHDGKKEGHGVNTWTSGVRYDGEWHAGTRSGQGVLTYSSGARYVGEFQDGKRNGHGVFTMLTGERVDAQWQDDAPNGLGSIVNATNGDRYDGELRGGQPNGKGVAARADGSRYEGEWSNGKFDGAGTLTLPGEAPFMGTWAHGCFSDRSRRAALGASQQACP
jgi:hypothetical protein